MSPKPVIKSVNVLVSCALGVSKTCEKRTTVEVPTNISFPESIMDDSVSFRLGSQLLQDAMLKTKWQRHGGSYPAREFICPECHAAEMARMAKSENIFERINAGVYESQPQGQRINADFKTDLFKHYGVSGPKAEKAFEIAYERGHSSGDSEVASQFGDLVPLIKG